MLVAIRNMFYVLSVVSCIAVCNKDGVDNYHLQMPFTFTFQNEGLHFDQIWWQKFVVHVRCDTFSFWTSSGIIGKSLITQLRKIITIHCKCN